MIESTYSLYKLIILYMLKKVKFPLTNAQISDFMLGREYTSYFHLQEVLSEMVGIRPPADRNGPQRHLLPYDGGRTADSGFLRERNFSGNPGRTPTVIC